MFAFDKKSECCSQTICTSASEKSLANLWLSEFLVVPTANEAIPTNEKWLVFIPYKDEIFEQKIKIEMKKKLAK